MKLFLAGTCSRPMLREEIEKSKYILESFVYVQEWQLDIIRHCDMFLLDSGAFTFMQKQKNHKVDWNEYLEQYIDFINKNDIKYFFELDIDSIVGYDKVLKMRKILEDKTGKKCIPVFHKSRGLKEWHKLCKEYDYVAIGTIYEYSRHPQILKKLLKIARQYNTKVHGLGFTISKVEEFPFYSCDSTTWLQGGRFGTVQKFRNGQLRGYKKKGYKTVHYVDVDRHNIREWIKRQQYLDKK